MSERTVGTVSERTVGTLSTPPPSIFEAVESEVRGYCRGWPVAFDTAVGSRMTDVDGRAYLDFFMGAGALNYGHNNPALKRPLLDYLTRDGVVHSLDMHTAAKAEFLETFSELILTPRGLDYKVMFPGPTGTNAVEAALKLARKVRGRPHMVNFTNSFHGMTLGSLAVTGNAKKRAGAGIPLVHATPMPFDNYLEGKTPDFVWFERLLDDAGSSLNSPAGVIVETVQGEGGLNASRVEWLQGLADLCRRHELLLIVDDVQMGCGRTGPFFSFEIAGIEPDIVCLSKSISGYGLPMALTLFKREHDLWAPGEHNGTFRGQNPSFVTATAALREYWADDTLQRGIEAKSHRVETALNAIANETAGVQLKGRGLAQGLSFAEPELADKAAAAAFERGLLIETAGPNSEVAKLFPALTITDDELAEGLDIFTDAVRSVTR